MQAEFIGGTAHHEPLKPSGIKQHPSGIACLPTQAVGRCIRPARVRRIGDVHARHRQNIFLIERTTRGDHQIRCLRGADTHIWCPNTRERARSNSCGGRSSVDVAALHGPHASPRQREISSQFRIRPRTTDGLRQILHDGFLGTQCRPVEHFTDYRHHQASRKTSDSQATQHPDQAETCARLTRGWSRAFFKHRARKMFLYFI